MYEVKGHTVYVKREDLCCSNHPYAPPFSKVRGLAEEMFKLASKGFKTVGYVETSVSMAGWGVAWLARQYELRPVIFDPQYVITPERLKMEPHLRLLMKHREMWRQFGAEVVSIKAGRAKVNYYIARKDYLKKFEKMTFLPLGLPLSDTRKETARIAKKESEKRSYGTVVVNVGSGTICSGVVRGFLDSGAQMIGVMGRTGSVDRKKVEILRRAGVFEKKKGGFFGFSGFRLIDPGYQYTQPAEGSAPFPCHPFYDLKAWKWLEENIEDLEPPVLFWNIGAAPDSFIEEEENARSCRQSNKR
jgi:hypothetical protein